jgi:Predicted integral membrane protein (DUF2269)
MRFAVELNHRIRTRLVIPLALSLLVSGSRLIWVTNLNYFQTWYLIVSVALYVAAVGISLGVLLPNTQKLMHLAERAQAAGANPVSPPRR